MYHGFELLRDTSGYIRIHHYLYVATVATGYINPRAKRYPVTKERGRRDKLKKRDQMPHTTCAWIDKLAAAAGGSRERTELTCKTSAGPVGAGPLQLP
jgi:hypothetical protein